MHRKRKRLRLEKEKFEATIESNNDEQEQLPHATYLQTLMTLAGETLSRTNNNEQAVPDVRSIFDSITTNNDDEPVNNTAQEHEQLEQINENDDDVFETPRTVGRNLF